MKKDMMYLQVYFKVALIPMDSKRWDLNAWLAGKLSQDYDSYRAERMKTYMVMSSQAPNVIMHIRRGCNISLRSMDYLESVAYMTQGVFSAELRFKDLGDMFSLKDSVRLWLKQPNVVIDGIMYEFDVEITSISNRAGELLYPERPDEPKMMRMMWEEEMRYETGVDKMACLGRKH